MYRLLIIPSTILVSVTVTTMFADYAHRRISGFYLTSSHTLGDIRQQQQKEKIKERRSKVLNVIFFHIVHKRIMSTKKGLTLFYIQSLVPYTNTRGSCFLLQN